MSARLVTTLAALTFGAVLLDGASAAAAPRAREVTATPIYRRTFYSSSTTTRTFATTNLRSYPALSCGTPDTILVVTRPNGAEVMNDDCNASTDRSCLTIGGAAGSWTITVFAAKESRIELAPPSAMTLAKIEPPTLSQTHCGLTDVTVNGAILDRDVVFGGALVEPGLSGSFTAETAHLPSGADDTVLLAYTGSWQELGFDNDSGVGRAARRTGSLSTTSKLVVGSFSEAAAGRTALVLNDCTGAPDASNAGACRNAGKDTDGDNLSNALEAELGTDPGQHDTDRDGLFDYYEVIGRQLPGGAEQELRRYGANPRRRDLFVELDREVNAEGAVGNLYGIDIVDGMFEDSFLDLPRLPAAPDGSRLIAIHVDTGAPCPTRPTLCGDWGGGEPVAATFVDEQDAGFPHFAAVRRGLFQYGYVTTGGTGQAYGSAFYARYPDAVVHELGHNLGLGHAGRPGQPRLNRKPNYPSLMNYQFQASMPGVTVGRSRFSEGWLPTLDGPVDEDHWDDGVDVRHLGPAWSYWLVNGAIDFNRDGRRGGPVFADHAPIGRATTGNDPWLHMAGAIEMNAATAATGCRADAGGVCRPSGGPALASFDLGGGSWLTMFTPYRHTSGLTYPDLSQTFDSDGTSGWWPTERGAPFDGAPTGEPAAAMFERSDNVISALLLFPHRDGRLHYRVVDMGDPDAGGWAPVPGQPVGALARHATLLRVGGELLAFWRDFSLPDDDANVYQARYDVVAGGWSDAELQPIASLTTPGVALAPDGAIYLAHVRKNDAGGGDIATHWRDPGAAWQATTIATTPWQFDELPPVALRPRLALELVPLVHAAGEPFADGTGQLHLYWTTHGSDPADRGDRVLYRAQLSGYIGPQARQLGSWLLRIDGSADRPQPGHSVATALRGTDLIAAYSATTWDATGSLPDGALRGARYLPYAFGIMPGFEGLLDNDDAAVITTQMCNALWQIVDGDGGADCRCASGAACSTTGTATLERMEPLCEPE